MSIAQRNGWRLMQETRPCEYQTGKYAYCDQPSEVVLLNPNEKIVGIYCREHGQRELERLGGSNKSS